jgi:hypothetical protein
VWAGIGFGVEQNRDDQGQGLDRFRARRRAKFAGGFLAATREDHAPARAFGQHFDFHFPHLGPQGRAAPRPRARRDLLLETFHARATRRSAILDVWQSGGLRGSRRAGEGNEPGEQPGEIREADWDPYTDDP